MSDRAVREQAIAAIIGPDDFRSIYSRLGLSHDWIDPIFGLDDLERLAIWVYTTPQAWYLIINNALWSESEAPEIAVFAETLNGAIRKLPRVQGIVYRGVQLEGDREHFLSTYLSGAVVTWWGFTSTTRERRKAYAGDVLFRINSRNGRFLQGFGADDFDEEILFESGTKFLAQGIISSVYEVILVDLVEM